MKIKSLAVAALLPLIAAQAAFSSDLALPQAPASVKVPAASAPSASPLITEYAEYYSALVSYSDKAFAADQNSADFYEARANGVYLRAKVQELAAQIGKLAVTEPGVCAALPAAGSALDSLLAAIPAAACPNAARGKSEGAAAAGSVSRKVSQELIRVFGTDSTLKEGKANEPIKAGYCQINYVKNGVPFLVQYDGFLKKGEVILTFDDGPGPVTGEFAAAMADAGAPSVFFVLGSKLGRNGKAIISSAAAAGHEIAVHGYWHATESEKPFTAMSTEAIVKQLSGVSGTITAAAGKTPTLFRPPYGIITPDALRALDANLGLTPVGWTVDTLDWSTKDPEELFNKTVAMIQRRGKGIVLMHDIHPQSRGAALRLAAWLKDNGFKVVSPERLTAAYRK